GGSACSARRTRWWRSSGASGMLLGARDQQVVADDFVVRVQLECAGPGAQRAVPVAVAEVQVAELGPEVVAEGGIELRRTAIMFDRFIEQAASVGDITKVLVRLRDAGVLLHRTTVGAVRRIQIAAP